MIHDFISECIKYTITYISSAVLSVHFSTALEPVTGVNFHWLVPE